MIPMNERSTDRNEVMGSIKKIIQAGFHGTQTELQETLNSNGLEVTQSTISRALRKLGAIKAVDSSGRNLYRLPDETLVTQPIMSSMSDLVLKIDSNGFLIVIHTQIGSANLVARFLDLQKFDGVMGTLAGDDTIFIAPKDPKNVNSIITRIQELIRGQ